MMVVETKHVGAF